MCITDPFGPTVMCVFYHIGRGLFYLLNDCKINFPIVPWAIVINFMLQGISILSMNGTLII